MERAISAYGQSVIPPTDPAAPLAIGDELMTVNDAARFLRVTVSWVYEHTRDDAEDRLPFVKLGKYVRFESHGPPRVHRRQAPGRAQRVKAALTMGRQHGTVKPQKARRATP